MKRFGAFTAVVAAMAIVPNTAFAEDLECVVERKFNVQGERSAADLARWQFSVRIVQLPSSVVLQRCSWSSAQERITCDSYEADRVEVAPGSGIRKFYSFAHQFDVQVWPTGEFVENNGRGSIAFGTCVAG
jgi:hypothetical protein